MSATRRKVRRAGLFCVSCIDRTGDVPKCAQTFSQIVHARVSLLAVPLLMPYVIRDSLVIAARARRESLNSNRMSGSPLGARSAAVAMAALRAARWSADSDDVFSLALCANVVRGCGVEGVGPCVMGRGLLEVADWSR